MVVQMVDDGTLDADEARAMLGVKLWPTPSAGMHKQDVNDAGQYAEGILADGHQIMLPAAVKLWPTPRSTDGAHGGRVTPRKSREGGNLIEAVSARNFPTPSANDWKGSSQEGQRRGQLTDPAMGAIPAGGQLNPDWVELLMGWPLGWTRLDSLDPAVFEAWREAFRSGDAVAGWQDGTWEDGVSRVAVKTAHRVPRLTGLGNGQVPPAVAAAWAVLCTDGATP